MLGKVDLTYLSIKMKIPKRYENNWVVLSSSAVRFAVSKIFLTIIFSYCIFLYSQRQNVCILRTRGSTPNATNGRLYRCLNYRLELIFFFFLQFLFWKNDIEVHQLMGVILDETYTVITSASLSKIFIILSR